MSILVYGICRKNRFTWSGNANSGLLKERGLPSYYTSLYPLPAWKIPTDVVFDAALIYAIVRQESQFKLRAKSGRGARGLMQLMPRTAAEMGRDRRFRRGKGRDALFNPKINIELGSKYLSHLMYNGDKVRNLFKTLAAYNAGPGKLGRWESKINYQNDPLMFMESIPSPETRNFIEQVLLAYGFTDLGRSICSVSYTTRRVIGRIISLYPIKRWKGFLMPEIDQSRAFVPINIAILTVSDTRTVERTNLVIFSSKNRRLWPPSGG